jgi:drug/metabolite transporter (DMT)-like permease
MVQNVTIDFFVASFWRPFLYVVTVVVIGLLGILGPLHFTFYWSIIALAPFGIFTTLFYTYLLQRVELTSMGAVAYITPLIFLFIDSDIVHVGLSQMQILGIFLLVAGGIGFAVDWKTFRFKPELDWRVWCMFIFGIAWGGVRPISSNI